MSKVDNYSCSISSFSCLLDVSIISKCLFIPRGNILFYCIYKHISSHMYSLMCDIGFLNRGPLEKFTKEN